MRMKGTSFSRAWLRSLLRDQLPLWAVMRRRKSFSCSYTDDRGSSNILYAADVHSTDCLWPELLLKSAFIISCLFWTSEEPSSSNARCVRNKAWSILHSWPVASVPNRGLSSVAIECHLRQLQAAMMIFRLPVRFENLWRDENRGTLYYEFLEPILNIFEVSNGKDVFPEYPNLWQAHIHKAARYRFLVVEWPHVSKILCCVTTQTLKLALMHDTLSCLYAPAPTVMLVVPRHALDRDC